MALGSRDNFCRKTPTTFSEGLVGVLFFRLLKS